MPQTIRYAIVNQLESACMLAGVPVAAVLRRAGLPTDFHKLPAPTVDASQFFSLWNALGEELQSIEQLLKLAVGYAHGPFAAPVFAFSCAATIEAGLRRLAEFKPLLGPCTLKVEYTEDTLVTTFRSYDQAQPFPPTLALFDFAYLIESARICTAQHVVPLVASCPFPDTAIDAVEVHLGIKLTRASESQLVFSLADAQLPLITHSTALWDSLEPDLQRRLQEQQQSITTRDRVRTILLQTLAGGAMNSSQIASKLCLSKRTLQRQLQEEGATFQQILTDTRVELSRHYLNQPHISLGEISYLLGFKDQTSFFRAYHNWTGTTPGESRNSTS